MTPISEFLTTERGSKPIKSCTATIRLNLSEVRISGSHSGGYEEFYLENRQCF
jgi:hypothetical protein